MPCPSCGYDNPAEARFCARCGNRLSGGGAAVTEELNEPGETKELTGSLPGPPSPEQEQRAPGGPVLPEVPVAEVLASARRRLVAGGWLAGLAAAAIGLAAAWACGAALVLAAKLEVPQLGAGAGFFDVLRAVAIAGLACLRVPVHFGRAEVSVLPLGALAVIGWVLAAAAAEQVARREPAGTSRWAAAADGAKTGAGLGLLCLLSALTLRFSGARPVAADPAMAVVLGTLWGALFGALGGLRARGERPSAWWGLILAWLGRLHPSAVPGANAGLLALVIAALAASGLVLLRIIVALLAGGAELSFGRVAAVLVFALAFAPNLIAAVAAFGLGAPLHVGARLTAGGRLIDAEATHSLLSWSGGPAPAWAFLALIVPLAAFVLAGFSARRSAGRQADARVAIGTLAALCALALAAVASLGEARLVGAALGRGGFVRLAVSPGWTLLLCLVWGGLAGWAGWRLASSEGRT